MATVFISHATADRPYVEQHIVTLLTAHGIRLWYCKESISTGSHWERSIREGLEQCDWFLAAISSQAIESEWVRCEVDWGIENRRDRIVPVRIAPCDPWKLHLKLRMIQYIDFIEPSAAAKQQLLAVWGETFHGSPGTAGRAAVRSLDGDLYGRPKKWHCIFCGWKCDESFNDYICKKCGQLRPYMGGSATVVQCGACLGFSLGVARFCEWCGLTV